MQEFYQQGPQLKNQYKDDHTLRSWLAWKVPEAARAEMEGDWQRLGERAVGDLLEMAKDADEHEPIHIPFDPWGKRVDDIQVSRGWTDLHRAAAEEGVVGVAYARKHGALSRLDQMARLYLFTPSSALVSCPMAMTDGAARAIELYGDAFLKDRAFPRLVSRDPDSFWTSGQWMTERTGGSDVGSSLTVARKDGDGWRLYGDKWFTSAVTADMAMTLARPEGAPPGGRGLSLFYLERRLKDGSLNHITIHRLKDKLGTRALPTAELTLDGTRARLVGDEGNGVRKIASLFNITRIYNSVCAVAGIRRAIAYARDYAGRREVFGKLLRDQPLHMETMAALQLEHEAAFHLTFHMVSLLGKSETGTASSEEEAVLRALTPITKLFTAKQAVAVASEVLESFGGMGYVEDTGLPRLLRDAQTLPIWEGTTNVLSLDMLRSFAKDGALEPLLKDMMTRLDRVARDTDQPTLQAATKVAQKAASSIAQFAQVLLNAPVSDLHAGSRGLAFSLARTYTASLLLERAQWDLDHGGDRRALTAAVRWTQLPLTTLVHPDAAHRQASLALAMSEPDVG